MGPRMATNESKLIVSLQDRLSGVAGKITGAIGRLQAMAARNNAAMDVMRGRMIDAVGAGYVLAQSLSAPINAAVAFEEKMADVAKVVDFESPAAFKQMGDDIRKMALRIPLAADGLADIVAAAGQSNIANADLLRFTELSAKVATAWDVTAGEAGDGLAKLKTSLNLTVSQTSSLADAINYLSNKTASAAPELFTFTKNVAPMAGAFGFTAEQAAALGAGMISAGFQADVAGTSFLNMGYALTAGKNATKGQRNAFKALGLSSKTVARDMQKNAVGTLDMVLQRIRKLPKEAQAATMVELFGKEARALSPLLTNGKLLAEVMGLVGDETQYAGSAQKEFDTRSKTSANNLQLFRNRLTDLAISVGDALLPSLNKLLDKLGPIVTNISDLAREYPGLTSAITTCTAAIVAFRIAITALRFAGLWAIGSFLSAAISFTGLAGVLTAVGAALAAISAPVWLTIAAAVALVAAAGAWLYAKWDRVSAVMSGVAEAIGQQLQPVIEAAQPVIDKLAPAFQAIGDAASWVKEQVSGLAGWFGKIFETEDLSPQQAEIVAARARIMTNKIINAFVEGHRQIFDAGSQMIQSLWDGMVAKFDEFIAWVQTIPAKIVAAIGKIDLRNIISWPSPPGWWTRLVGGGEPASTTTTTTTPAVDGERAAGGPVGRGKTYLVGERGPELFSPSRAGVITPNHALRQSSSAGGLAGGATVHITANPTINISGAGNPQVLADEITRRHGASIKSAIESSLGGGGGF